MSKTRYIAAPRIFDGDTWHRDAARCLEGKDVRGVVPARDIPGPARVRTLEEGFLAPGFVDLQVNGGGGVMLNNQPDLAGIETICATHARLGTTSLFPTLITDTAAVRDRTITAAAAARNEAVPGFAGLHLEGPHISIARKGAHDPALIRPMDEADLAALVKARAGVGDLVITLAPEAVDPGQVRRLTEAGLKVSLGHSDATMDDVMALVDAGASLFTHLFNAMSQLTGREPGLVGAAFRSGHASLIADGHHVCPTSIRIALAAKGGRRGNLFLISDAMSCVGTDVQEFKLNGRRISRKGNRLTLEDGTLAGADLFLAEAVRFMHTRVRLELGEALRMAALYPAIAIGRKDIGRLAPGGRADFVWMDDEINVRRTWIGGQPVA